MEWKPCPFCGCEAKEMDYGPERLYVRFGHDRDCWIAMYDGTHFLRNKREETIDSWNTRHERTCNLNYIGGGFNGMCSSCNCVICYSDRYCSRCGSKVVKE